VSPTTISASKRLKRPRTLDTPRCRIENPTNEWCGSTAHRPGVKGIETPVVDAMVMPGTLLDDGSGRETTVGSPDP
jgi:hypothetical protein